MDHSVKKIQECIDVYEAVWECPIELAWLASGILAAMYKEWEVALVSFKVLSAVCVGDMVGRIAEVSDYSWTAVVSMCAMGLGHTLQFPFGFILIAVFMIRVAKNILQKNLHQLSQLPKERLNDVVPLGKAKEKIAEIIAYLHNPEPFIRIGAQPPRGILLIGPPGTGKTLLAKALANEIGPYTSFIQTTGSQLKSKWVGESAEKIRALFDKAQAHAKRQQECLEMDASDDPALLGTYRGYCVLFIDEIDSVGSREYSGVGNANLHQDRVDTINELLAQMDGFSPNDSVLVIGTTNDVSRLDPAILSRMPCQIKTEMPNNQERSEIFERHLRGVALDGAIDLTMLAARTPGLSGRDIKHIVEAALWSAATQEALGVDQARLCRAIDDFNKDRPIPLDILDKGLALS